MNNNAKDFEANENLTDDELAVFNNEKLWNKVAESSRKGGKNRRLHLPKN